MSNSNIIIPSELSKVLNEREKVLTNIERAQSLVGELGRLSSSIPECKPAGVQLQSPPENTPLTQIELALPLVKNEIATINKLKAEVKGCEDKIKNIHRKEKLIITISISAIIMIIIIILITVIVLLRG